MGARWRQLFGDFAGLGVSFEWHELEAGGDISWSQTFHPEGVEICLNLAGCGEVGLGETLLKLGPGTAGFYRQGSVPLHAVRRGGEKHQFITVELSPEFLQRQLTESMPGLHPMIVEALQGTKESGLGTVAPLSIRQRDLVTSLRQPPVLASAQPIWYQAKAVELIGEFLFQASSNPELFCRRQQLVARDRVERVAVILRRDLTNPPTLEELGREVGCSPFYLSRTFSKETGQTLPQYLRALRLEKAADLLKSGRYNVTEAAAEVGYNSLSHFSQAFHQHFGCCPGLYPMATPSQRAVRNGSQPSGKSA